MFQIQTELDRALFTDIDRACPQTFLPHCAESLAGNLDNSLRIIHSITQNLGNLYRIV